MQSSLWALQFNKNETKRPERKLDYREPKLENLLSSDHKTKKHKRLDNFIGSEIYII